MSAINFPAVNQVGQVTDPSTANLGVAVSSPVNLGPQGDQLASELHGKFYSAAIRGTAFSFRTAEAGITVPISSATAGVYVINNPLGSGRVVELIRVVLGLLTATEVVGGIGFGCVASSTISAFTTAGVIVPLTQGGNSRAPVATAWTSVTQTAVGATGGIYKPLFSVPGTASTNAGVLEYDFDGTLNLAPGQAVTLIASGAAQTAAMVVDTVWAEWPYPLN